MSGAMLGGLLGATAGVGLYLIGAHAMAARRPDFEGRVLRHLTDVPELNPVRGSRQQSALGSLVDPILGTAAHRLGLLLGGTDSVRRRLVRADLSMAVADFRVQQVLWGLAAFGASGVVAVYVSLQSPDRTVPLLLMCVLLGLGGVLLRENRLTAQVRAHETEVLAELPALAELLALAVAAGEGPVPALARVAQRSQGALSRELSRVLGEIRTGTPVAVAFDAYAARSGLPVVSRFASGLAVAVERGTPLADVLHAQAADVREAQRRQLIESGARREIAMMIPVVFLVLPTTVIFAFWPGVVGLRLVTP